MLSRPLAFSSIFNEGETMVKIRSRIRSCKPLCAEHNQHLLNAGITPEVIRDRGYYSAWYQHELTELGFSSTQSKTVPALVIPIWGVYGKVVSYQIRPNFPRSNDGKVCKYEMPSGSVNRLDIPKRSLKDINDVDVPLWITEGIKKADAAVSNGLCCIALFGVWNWLTKTNEQSESQPIDDFNYIALGHRRVYICFDSDVMTNPKVAQALRRLKAMLRGRNATVISIYLPANDGNKVGLDDYFADGGTVEDLYTFTKSTSNAVGPTGIRPELPTIKTHNIQLAPNVDETLEAVVEANHPPIVFNYSGKLTRLRVDETNQRFIPRLEMMNKDAVVNHLSRVANFVSISTRGETSVNPPDVVARMLICLPEWSGIPKVSGVVTSPIFAQDGTLCSTPGYDPASRMLYYERTPLKLSSISSTSRNKRSALRMIDDLFTDFPFADAASKAHAIGFLLLPFVRELIDGPTPLHLFDAPKAGTGKSLLMSVLASIFIPRGVSLQAAPKEEEEWRKRLTTIFREGSSHCLFDNIRDLSSESLQAALTAPDCLWRDRLLGGNESVQLPIRCVWAATTNNITGTLEQLRRCVEIRIDAKTEKPEERIDFKHPDIKAWVRNHRSQLVSSILIIVNAWIDEGKPSYSNHNAPMGSFEAWSSVIGGILETNGIEGFLDNRRSFTEHSDSERGTLRALISDWFKKHGAMPVSSSQLLPIARLYYDRELGEGTEHSQKIRLGKLLAHHRDQVINDLILHVKPTDSGNSYWLEELKK